VIKNFEIQKMIDHDRQTAKSNFKNCCVDSLYTVIGNKSWCKTLRVAVQKIEGSLLKVVRSRTLRITLVYERVTI